MRERIFVNGRIVTEHEVFTGGVEVRSGRIHAVHPTANPTAHPDGPAGREEVIDLEGDYLLPGLIDVHSDSLEQQFTPRHGVYWPSPLSAAKANDALLFGCGITTVLDSICAEAFPEEQTRQRMFNDCVAAVTQGEQGGLMRSQHLLHLRCETADPKTPGILGEHMDNPLVRLISLMDHTPGQRQYRDVNKFREYYTDEGWSDAEFDAVVARLRAEQGRYAGPQRADIIARARQKAIPLASHDDATVEHVRQARREGISICEFPTSKAAARAARQQGMDVVMGAPNIVLGGSHSGNVSALEVFREGDLTVLASDYVPASLLLAPFALHVLEKALLHECIRLVTANPARMTGLADRGAIAPGMRADLVRVRLVEGQPLVMGVWTAGG